MSEPTNVGFKEGAQIGNAVFQHGKAFNANAESKTLPLLGINVAVFKHVRVHHATTHDFQPVLARTDFDLFLAARSANIDFCRRLGERKEAWAETHGHIVYFKKRAQEFFYATL